MATHRWSKPVSSSICCISARRDTLQRHRVFPTAACSLDCRVKQRYRWFRAGKQTEIVDFLRHFTRSTRKLLSNVLALTNAVTYDAHAVVKPGRLFEYFERLKLSGSAADCGLSRDGVTRYNGCWPLIPNFREHQFRSRCCCRNHQRFFSSSSSSSSQINSQENSEPAWWR